MRSRLAMGMAMAALAQLAACGGGDDGDGGPADGPSGEAGAGSSAASAPGGGSGSAGRPSDPGAADGPFSGGFGVDDCELDLGLTFTDATGADVRPQWTGCVFDWYGWDGTIDEVSILLLTPDAGTKARPGPRWLSIRADLEGRAPGDALFAEPGGATAVFFVDTDDPAEADAGDDYRVYGTGTLTLDGLMGNLTSDSASAGGSSSRVEVAFGLSDVSFDLRALGVPMGDSSSGTSMATLDGTLRVGGARPTGTSGAGGTGGTGGAGGSGGAGAGGSGAPGECTYTLAGRSGTFSERCEFNVQPWRVGGMDLDDRYLVLYFEQETVAIDGFGAEVRDVVVAIIDPIEDKPEVGRSYPIAYTQPQQSFVVHSETTVAPLSSSALNPEHDAMQQGEVYFSELDGDVLRGRLTVDVYAFGYDPVPITIDFNAVRTTMERLAQPAPR